MRLKLLILSVFFREEAETDENKKKSDDMRLQLALQKSKEETDKVAHRIIDKSLVFLREYLSIFICKDKNCVCRQKHD